METATLVPIIATVVLGGVIGIVGWLLKRSIDGVDEKVRDIKDAQKEQAIAIDIIKSNASNNFSLVHARISDTEKDAIETSTWLKAHEKYLHPNVAK